jgi:hypothetical protein
MNSFRRITTLHHVADTSSVVLITRSVDDRFGCPCLDCEINGTTAPSTGVWRYFPLVTTDPNAITPSIHSGPHVAGTVLGRVSPTGTVAVVCSVSGDFVDPVHWASTSDWDYITSPMPGWVSDALINTNGATAPRC